ncbi:MAG TPA: Xaa-Pro peptidase family protein [candidate division Zixibacteria bacterium]|nr:Xaa-Pro peptidase family protein [candidate division Zixibacteria bacterium]
MATEAPFPEEEYQERYRRAQALMARDGLDALVISEKNNYWYFTGLITYQLDHIQRPQICILPKSGKPLLLVYGNDKAKARALPWVGEVRSYTDVPFPQAMIAACILEMGLGESRLGFELGDDQRLGFPVNYLSRLAEALPKAEIEDGTAALTEMRLTKSAREIELMRKACAISVKAYERCLPQLRPGITRREVAERLYIAMIQEGAHPRHPGFLMLNASTRYDDRRYDRGDRMIADFGACYEGYYGDVTRMAIFGRPTEEHKKDHETACDVIELCFESMRPGTPVAEVSRIANRELVKRGYQAVESPKRIGHGIGMSRAEPPSLNEVEKQLYRPGMVLALEPKVRSEKSAVHLEEDVLITENGPEFLTGGCRRLDIID